VELGFVVVLDVLLSVLFTVVCGGVPLLQDVVVLRVDDFFVDAAELVFVDFTLVFECFSVVGVDDLQVVGAGHFHPTHLDVVDFAELLDLVGDEGVDVGPDDGVVEDVQSGGAQGSVDSRFLAT
jgi:hypothetical protein